MYPQWKTWFGEKIIEQSDRLRLDRYRSTCININVVERRRFRTG